MTCQGAPPPRGWDVNFHSGNGSPTLGARPGAKEGGPTALTVVDIKLKPKPDPMRNLDNAANLGLQLFDEGEFVLVALPLHQLGLGLRRESATPTGHVFGRSERIANAPRSHACARFASCGCEA